MARLAAPLWVRGEVVAGFGRGSKQLGCPTANYPLGVVQELPGSVEPGVYYGWAQVDSSPIYKMVANIGWCPFYQNNEKSIETHIMHKFNGDFYGSTLKIGIVGYLRGEMNFSSLDGLIAQIQEDIRNAEELLDESENQKLKLQREYDLIKIDHVNGSSQKGIYGHGCAKIYI